jgi:hypothetical protein
MDKKPRALSESALVVVDGYLDYLRQNIVTSAVRNSPPDDRPISSSDILDFLPHVDFPDDPILSDRIGSLAAFGIVERKSRQRERLRLVLQVYALVGLVTAIVAVTLRVANSDSSDSYINLSFVSGLTGLIVALIATTVSFYTYRDSKRMQDRAVRLLEGPSGPSIKSAGIATFLRGWNALEAAVRSNLSDDKDEPERIGLRKAVDELVHSKLEGETADDFRETFFELLAMRNDLVHGEREFDSEQLMHGIDEALRLLDLVPNAASSNRNKHEKSTAENRDGAEPPSDPSA